MDEGLRTITIIQSTIFTAYIAWIWSRYGVLDSISDSWYRLGKKSPLFTLFIWAIALPMCFMNNMWYFFAGAFLCFTGAAAEFKRSLTDKVHGIGAVGGIALSLVGLTLNNVIWPVIAVVVISLSLRYLKVSNTTWWVEIAAFIIIEIGIWRS